MKNKNINLILQNKIIKKVEVDGFGVYLEFEDGTFFNFEASDSGYSTYEYGRLKIKSVKDIYILTKENAIVRKEDKND